MRLLWMFSLALLTLLFVLYLLSIVHFSLLVYISCFHYFHEVVYTFLLSENLSTPHCVVKFAPIFGSLYCHVPGVSCFCLMLIVLSLILPGKLHMEFFTLLIVLLLLVTLFSCLVFVLLRLNLSIIFSSNALLLSLFFLGFNPLCFVGLCLLLLSLSVIFVSVLALTSFLASQKCSSTS